MIVSLSWHVINIKCIIPIGELMRKKIRNAKILCSSHLNWRGINDKKGRPRAGINRIPLITTFRRLFSSPCWLLCILIASHTLKRDAISNAMLIKMIATIGPKDDQGIPKFTPVEKRTIKYEGSPFIERIIVHNRAHNNDTPQPMGIKYLESFLVVCLILTIQMV